MESEKTIEKFCQTEAKRTGGLAIKWNAPAVNGVPDRIIFYPNGKIGFLELKSYGKKPTKLQQYWLDLLTSLGFIAEYADSKDTVVHFLNKVKNKC